MDDAMPTTKPTRNPWRGHCPHCGKLLAAPTKRPTHETIIGVAALVFGVEPQSLIAKGDRRREIGAARNLAFMLLRDVSHLSFPAIGRLFKRDHTTVMYGYAKAVARLSEADTRYAADFAQAAEQALILLSSTKRKRKRNDSRRRPTRSLADPPQATESPQGQDGRLDVLAHEEQAPQGPAL